MWDDVERKVKLTEEAREYKKRAVLDQEKSKLSLGEIYEKEYLQQMEASFVHQNSCLICCPIHTGRIVKFACKPFDVCLQPV